MANVKQTLEVERVINLVKGFGWDKVEEKIDGDEIKITIKKTIVGEVQTSPPE